MGAASTAMQIAKDWIDKGDSEQHCFDQFICYWISFNCFYSTLTRIESDKEAIKKIREGGEYSVYYTSDFKEKYSKELNNLRNIGSLLKGYSKSEYKPKISSKFKFEEVIELLYKIRNNLFHGNKSIQRERDVKVIENAVPVLKIIVKESFKLLQGSQL